LLYGQARLIDQIGAPVDVVSLADLLAGKLSAYKFYIFGDAFVLDAGQRQALRQHAMQDGQLCLWLYAAGGIEEALTGQAMKELTGIALTVLNKSQPARIEMPGGHPLYSPKISGTLEFGLPGDLVPLFAAVGRGCDILGTLAGSTWGGMAAVKREQFTSVYSAVPGLPPQLLRSLALAAGCHLPTDRPCYYTQRGELVAVGALETVPHLRFDEPVDILCNGQRLFTAATTVQPPINPGEAVVLQVRKPQH